MDELDRAIINSLQGSFSICGHPFAEVAARLHTAEQELISRVSLLLKWVILSCFGPMYHAKHMGGSLSLAAMKIPESDFERVAEIVNTMPEVAHNYARDHVLSMWFVLAVETPQEHAAVLEKIEWEAGYPVYDILKIKKYVIGLRLAV